MTANQLREKIAKQERIARTIPDAWLQAVARKNAASLRQQLKQLETAAQNPKAK